MSPVTNWADLMNDAKVEAVAFSDLEPGTYSFVIKDAAKAKQTGKGLPKFSIHPSVEAGPRMNARIFHDFNVTENAGANARFFFTPLAALGLNDSFFATNPSPEAIAQALQGRRFVATVFNEVGTDGVTRPRLKDFAEAVGNAPAGGGLPGLGGPVMASQPLPAATAPAAPAPAAQAPQYASAAPAASPWDNVNANAAPPATPFSNTVAPPPAF